MFSAGVDDGRRRRTADDRQMKAFQRGCNQNMAGNPRAELSAFPPNVQN